MQCMYWTRYICVIYIYIYTYIWHIYIYTHREIFFPLKWRHLLAPYVPCFKTMGPWHTFCMNFDEDLRPLLRNVRFVRQNRTVFKSTVFLGTSVLIQLMVGFGPTGQLFGWAFRGQLQWFVSHLVGTFDFGSVSHGSWNPLPQPIAVARQTSSNNET